MIRSTSNEGVGKGLFFLDSGAHSLYTKHVIARKHRDGYAFYDGLEFKAYCDEYAAFVKKHASCIDYYANVDVIFDPDRSWKTLKYLENEHGLRPVPVIHYGAAMSWVHKHLDAGYEFLGIGGLGQEATAAAYRKWADNVFSVLCPGPSYLPVARTHGFAMTSFSLMRRYPWWSVDSASWTKSGAFGNVMIPHRRSGAFTFDTPPYVICMSCESPSAKKLGDHYLTVTKAEQATVRAWLEEINIPLGKGLPGDEDFVEGVLNHHSHRKIANLMFFERLRASLPAYPWPFRPVKKAGFGLAR